MSKKKINPFKPATPQNADYFINCVKDETLKKYLQKNLDKSFHRYPKDGLFKEMYNFIQDSFMWSTTQQEYYFWNDIFNHFLDGHGLKTYNDFKHLDESIK